MGQFFKSDIIHALTLAVTVGALLLGAFWTLRSAQEAQQVALAGFEARLVIAERTITTRQETDDRFASEMRAALAVITNGVADLRVQEAKRK
jgi:hypothetical protein